MEAFKVRVEVDTKVAEEVVTVGVVNEVPVQRSPLPADAASLVPSADEVIDIQA